MDTLTWQGSLLAGERPGFDPSFDGLHRRDLGSGAWVDHLPSWVSGADRLFESAVSALDWTQGIEHIHGQDLLRPRLTCWMAVDDLPDDLSVLRAAGAALSHRYSVRLHRVGANLYRDGRDSVAWHGDRVARDRPTATIAIVSLGQPRRFRLRPRGGGTGPAFDLGSGDLLVMGGTCQRTWQHSVPKVAAAGPRVSITYRHATDQAPTR